MTTDPDPLDQAALALSLGRVVCIPTESTYGLAVDIRVPASLVRLDAIKRDRPAGAPYPLIAPDLEAARALARVWPAAADELAARFWPGPLTLVVPARANLPTLLVGPGGGVGVRVSSHPIARELARRIGGVITATSANRSSAPPATRMSEARAIFADEIACYLDGGTCDGMPSTVVAVDHMGGLRLLRRGAVDLEL